MTRPTSILTRCLLVFLLLWATATMAQVAPTTLFQLDGNAANSSLTCTYASGSGPCDYWNLVNGTGAPSIITQTQTPPTASGNWSARTFINGTSTTNSFTGGGSKDPNPISQWKYSTSPTPNKDTLNAGYSAAYIAPGGDFEVMFGANRLSPNGDANIGIWFFQNQVGPNGSGGFTGSHVDHDIFVISAFTNGGGTSGIAVYEWDHTCTSGVKNPANGQCADSNLRLLANPSAVCGSSLYCAITNATSTSSTWGGSLASPLFFEGGVDITAALASAQVTDLPCFSSFLVETRSSQSPSAVLKDFLAGGFPVCSVSVSKACGIASVNSGGTSISYPVSGTVTNTGIGTLYNVSVSDAITYTDKAAETLTLAVTPSTLAKGQSGTWSTTLTSTATSVQDQATASGTTSSSGGTTVTSTPTNLITCGIEVQSALKVTKMCSTSLAAENGVVDVNVAFNGVVCNTGKSAITGLTLVDYQGSSSATHSVTPSSTGLAACTTVDGVTGLCTAPANACTTYSGSYAPSTIDATATAGRYFFNDEVVVTGATATIGTLTKVTTSDTRCNNQYGCASASCPICDKNQCVQ
jgi:hypothetical protein